MVQGRKYVYVKEFHGTPADENIQLQTETVPTLQAGDVLFKSLFLSVDPYMRVFGNSLNNVMGGEQLSLVVESKDSKYKVGEKYLIKTGWREYSVLNPSKLPDVSAVITATPPVPSGLSDSLLLGALGMPGATAYLSLIKRNNPKPGNTLFINAAAGTVGTIIGQIGKILGLKVIGCAGDAKKVEYLKSIGFDVAFNYKTEDLSAALTKAAPNGIDCFIDMVGGRFTQTLISKHMAPKGHVTLVGAISTYNNTSVQKEEPLWGSIQLNSLTVSGFLIYAIPYPEWLEAYAKLGQWIKEGKIKTPEHVTYGFENMRKGFYQLFTGDNIGKNVIKA